jgi:hypothetical protein
VREHTAHCVNARRRSGTHRALRERRGVSRKITAASARRTRAFRERGAHSRNARRIARTRPASRERTRRFAQREADFGDAWRRSSRRRASPNQAANFAAARRISWIRRAGNRGPRKLHGAVDFDFRFGVGPGCRE